MYIYHVIQSFCDFKTDGEDLTTNILYCGFSKNKSNRVFCDAIVKNLGYDSVDIYNEENDTSFEKDFSQEIQEKSYYDGDSSQTVGIWIKTTILDIDKEKEQFLEKR